MIWGMNVIAWTWLPSTPGSERPQGAPWDVAPSWRACRTAVVLQIRSEGTNSSINGRKCTRASYYSKHIGYWLFVDPPALGQRTERHVTAVVGSYQRPRPLYTTTQLRRCLEKLIHYMRVLLDFLGTPTSPALPSFTHVGVFRRRLRCEGKHAMLTYIGVSSCFRLNIEADGQFFHAVPTMGSSTSQSSVRKCANAP